MSILKNLLKGFIKIFLVLTIILFILASTGAHFTEKENLKYLIQEIMVEQIDKNYLKTITDELNNLCYQHENEVINRYVYEINTTINIDCTKISEEYAKKIFKDYVVDKEIENLYAQKCTGFKCFANFSAAASQSAHSFLRKLEVVFAILALIFVVLLFLLTKKVSNKMFAIGIPLFICGVPYFFIETIKKKIFLTISNAVIIKIIIDAIFDYASNLFLVILIISIILIAIGFIIKIIFKKS
ncbi:MAG: hypothetical protein QW041_00995 [Candidatus Pacearchaeota archaeon]